MNAKNRDTVILQAVVCVEELINEAAKEGGRPWVAVVKEHMEALLAKPIKPKPKSGLLRSLSFVSPKKPS